MYVLTVAQMREIERAADAAGLSYSQMMQNAGRAAAEVILQRLAGWRLLARTESNAAFRVLVLAGPGNNGGDGLVCAQALFDASRSPGGPSLTVQVYLLKARATDDPVFAGVHERDIFTAVASEDMRLRVLRQLASQADLIVDALLGTGRSRPIDTPLSEILDVVRASLNHPQDERYASVVALDGVTGMDYDTGMLDPKALQADVTVTFHAPKRGHYCFPASRANGELVVTPIGIEHLGQSLSPGEDGDVQLASDELIRTMLPRREDDSNKGSYGKVLVVGGCIDYSGAPALAAQAAYRVGSGLVTLAVPHNIQATVSCLCREATFATLNGTVDYLSREALPRLAQAMNGLGERCAIVLGPGMGQGEGTGTFLPGILGLIKNLGTSARVVIDADALNLLSTNPDWPELLPPGCILTPHPGEMARLTGLSVPEVQANRIAHAIAYAHRWGQIIVLKGAFTVVANSDHAAIVLPFANSALAVAGTGDVLAGSIAGMLAQGLSQMNAAVCGAYLHAKAGDRWREQHGTAGLLAGDLPQLLPDVLSALRH